MQKVDAIWKPLKNAVQGKRELKADKMRMVVAKIE
jgi:hypothetical protein